MTETIFQKQLQEMNACAEACKWVGERHAGRAWRECERGDWMLWLAFRCGVDRKLLMLASCACARTALKFVPTGETRPQTAIETAECWARGDTSVTLNDVQFAARAAFATAHVAGYAAGYAGYAVYADAAAAHTAAAYAKAEGQTSRKKSLCISAKIVRKHIPWTVLRAAYAEKMKGK